MSDSQNHKKEMRVGERRTTPDQRQSADRRHEVTDHADKNRGTQRRQSDRRTQPDRRQSA